MEWRCQYPAGAIRLDEHPAGHQLRLFESQQNKVRLMGGEIE